MTREQLFKFFFLAVFLFKVLNDIYRIILIQRINGAGTGTSVLPWRPLFVTHIVVAAVGVAVALGVNVRSRLWRSMSTTRILDRTQRMIGRLRFWRIRRTTPPRRSWPPR